MHNKSASETSFFLPSITTSSTVSYGHSRQHTNSDEAIPVLRHPLARPSLHHHSNPEITVSGRNCPVHSQTTSVTSLSPKSPSPTTFTLPPVTQSFTSVFHPAPVTYTSAARLADPSFPSSTNHTATTKATVTVVPYPTHVDTFSTEGKVVREDEIVLKSMIGEGQFGQVYEAVCRQKRVAVKLLPSTNFNDEQIEEVKREIQVMSKFSHPNLCMYMGVCTEFQGKIAIIMELYNQSLDKLLFSTHQLSLPMRMRMALDVAQGMNWLHCNTPKLIHSDLKVGNILIADNNRCVVSDFGEAEIFRDVKEQQNSGGGTLLYMAPEKLQSQSYTDSIDVYSFGLLLWELFTRRRAFEMYINQPCVSFITAICERGERPQIPEGCPNSLKRLIVACWSPNPELRPPFSTIISALQEVIVDCSFNENTARKFWKVNFGTNVSVEWVIFSQALRNFLRRHSTFWIKALIGEKKPYIASGVSGIQGASTKGTAAWQRSGAELYVSCEKFGNLVTYFGPLVREVGPMKLLSTCSRKSTNFLDKVQCTLMSPWFHGEISSADAACFSEHTTNPRPF
ncbi:dual specificity protein kinase [Pelomyxa schiedti]|nr:dual specificity protein kinase [Pelomyxa schiedti]